MLANLFALIRLILAGLSLWDGFVDSIDADDLAKREERRQARDQAAREIVDAKSEEEFDRAQDRLVDSKPAP